MTENVSDLRQSSKVLHEAAEWLLRQERNELDEGDWRSFEQWLRTNTAHEKAFEDVLWALGAAERHKGTPELLELRNQALHARKNSRWTLVGLSSFAAAAACFALFWLLSGVQSAQQFKPDTITVVAQQFQGNVPLRTVHSTAIGERSEIALPDGSTATLDTNSRLEIAFSATERRVYLVRGQALFDVAKNKKVPFRVFAGRQTITAIGTIFNVRLNGEAIRISMVEGAVKVRQQGDANAQGIAALPDGLIVKAGDILDAGPNSVKHDQQADVGSAASWKGGTLVFEDVRLADAVAELNRYTVLPIAIADSSIGDYRVTGVFKTNDPKRFSVAMTEIFPLEISYSSDGAAVLRSSSAGQ